MRPLRGAPGYPQASGTTANGAQDAPLLKRVVAPTTPGPVSESVNEARHRPGQTDAKPWRISRRLAADSCLDPRHDLDHRDLGQGGRFGAGKRHHFNLLPAALIGVSTGAPQWVVPAPSPSSPPVGSGAPARIPVLTVNPELRALGLAVLGS